MLRSTEVGGQGERFDEIARLIEGARTIAICAHTAPDGDAIGSGLALAELIRRRWPGRVVTGLLADADPVPRTYAFLPGAQGLVRAVDYEGSPDLFICVDLSQAARLADARAVLERSAHVAVIDHHPAAEPVWDAAVVRSDAAATGVLVTEFADHVGCELTPSMAQNLLCALITDTGRFQYQNANGEAFEVASALVDAGASPADVALHVYQSDRLAYLHLAAVVMGRITTFERGRISYSYATAADFAAHEVPLAETDGLIDLVRCVEGSEVALFLKETAPGRVRGNLRAKTDLDVSAVARELGGGGHRAAAGFTFEGDIDQALAVTLPKLRALYPDGGTR